MSRRELPDGAKRAPGRLAQSIAVVPKVLFVAGQRTMFVIWGVIGFVMAQMYGFLRNAGAMLGGISVTDILPRTFARYWTDGKRDVRERGPAAVGWGTRKKQITTGIMLGGFFIATSLVSGGVTLALVLLIAVPVTLFGVLRFIPVVNSNWKKTRRGVERGAKKTYHVRKRGGK